MPQGCGCGSGSGSTGTCADVATCVAGMVEGTNCLAVTGTAPDQTLTPVISQQAGNLLSCAEDGLLVAGEVTPTFCSAPTIGTPAWIASGDCVYGPPGSPAVLDAVLDHRLDGVFNQVHASPDGVMLWGLAPSATSTLDFFFDIDFQERDFYTPEVATGTVADMDASTYRNARSPAGNSSGMMPNNGQYITMPSDKDTSNGGWWGWGSREFSPMTVRQALDYLACRAYAIVRILPTNWHTVESQAQILADELSASGRSAGVIVAIDFDETAAGAILNAAGIATAARMTTAGGYTGDSAALVAAGFTYALPNPVDVTADALADLYANDDLTVFSILTLSRHYKADIQITAGADGIIVQDPVYTRGYDGLDATNYFKKPTIHYDYNQQIGSSTFAREINSGYTRLGQPGRWLFINNPPVRNRNAVLFGGLEIDDPTNWQMTWVMSHVDTYRTTSTLQRIGISFGNPIDADPWETNLDSATPDAQCNNYMVSINTGNSASVGNLVVNKTVAGVISTPINGPSVGYFSSYRCGLAVTPSAFTFTVYNSDWSVDEQVTLSDPDFRGGYVWGVSQTNTGSTGYEARWTNVAIGPPPT